MLRLSITILRLSKIILRLSRTVLGLSGIVWDCSTVLLVAPGRDYTRKTEIVYLGRGKKQRSRRGAIRDTINCHSAIMQVG
jgi:hypothetical protein